MSSALTNQSTVVNGSTTIDYIDFDENLTFEQLIDEYNDNTTVIDNSSNNTNHTNSTGDDVDFDSLSVETNDRDAHPFSSGEDICVTDRATKSLRQYIEKECYCHYEWNQELKFRASLDQKTYTDMDVTRYVGNLQYKEKVKKGSHRIYFDPAHYPVEEELEKQKEITDDMTVQERVKQNFKSSSYIKLSKNLREASGKCGFNITQNGNQKFTYKKSGLVIRNRFSC